MKIKDISILAILSVVLFVQEEILVFLPNISLTVLLLVLYSKRLGITKTSFIIIIYLLFDNLFMSSFNMIITPFMFLGWFFIPLLLNTVFKKVDKTFSLALVGALLSLGYCWIYIIPNVIILKVSFMAYLLADFPFEILLSVSSFISILWLYEPLDRVLIKLLKTFE